MTESLLVAGIVCIVAAIVGGGVKLLGAEMPVLNSFPRQALLFAVGLGFLFASFQANRTKAPAPAAATPATASKASSSTTSGPGETSTTTVPAMNSAGPYATTPSSAGPVGCPEAAALACLPKSSAPVAFANPAAANAAASVNIQDALSTTAAAAAAAREGATGRAARLCGIIASNDSSPLGKHLAAVRLTNPGPGDGQASAPCLKVAGQFL